MLHKLLIRMAKWMIMILYQQHWLGGCCRRMVEHEMKWNSTFNTRIDACTRKCTCTCTYIGPVTDRKLVLPTKRSMQSHRTDQMHRMRNGSMQYKYAWYFHSLILNALYSIFKFKVIITDSVLLMFAMSINHCVMSLRLWFFVFVSFDGFGCFYEDSNW